VLIDRGLVTAPHSTTSLPKVEEVANSHFGVWWRTGFVYGFDETDECSYIAPGDEPKTEEDLAEYQAGFAVGKKSAELVFNSEGDK